MILADWPGGSWQDTVRLVAAVGVAYVAVLWLAAGVWVYRDVKARTNDGASQAIAVILVILFNLPGLLLYLILRPQETLAETYERSLEADALVHELEDQRLCPSCRRRVEEDYVICPYCRAPLREPCTHCGRALSLAWSACPYCGRDRAPASARPSQELPAFARVPTESGAGASPRGQSGRPAQARPRRRAAGTPTPRPAGPAESEPFP